MMSANNDTENTEHKTIAPVVAVVVAVARGRAETGEQRFTQSFVVGRSEECDLRVSGDCVSRRHLRVDIVDGQCRVTDLNSANGMFANGERVGNVEVTDCAEIELGQGGALITLRVEREQPAVACREAPPVADFASETQIIRHYFDKKDGEDVGEQTMMFRRAFQRVQKKKSRGYQVFLGIAVLLLAVAGGVIFFQSRKLARLKSTAESIFYTTKSLELQISKLEQIVLLNADPKQVAELKEKRLKLKDMEKEYDNFVKELGTYKKAPQDEQLILRVARTFGECDVNAPKGFVDEVRRYIGMWKSSGRLRDALRRGREKGYPWLITRVLKDNNLPQQYVFLALQESNFDERAIGPQTSYGFAKGMWQFISPTASQYGLQLGPLHGQPVYDPLDERFDSVKSTVAAIKYIKDMSGSQAQASGLLVMASYNWGQNNVRQIIQKMPENPRERNFWRLLAYKNIPRETYDYVFSIVSAAVICENPDYFGVEVACPTLVPRK